MSTPALLDPFPAQRPAFRRRIVLLSHLMRVLAVIWALWNLVTVVRSLVNVARAPGIADVGHYGLFAAAVVLAATCWLLIAAVAYCVWCLFGTYLQGRIFAVSAALWMRRTGAVGLAGSLLIIVWRRFQILAATGHIHLSTRDLLFAPVSIVLPTDLVRIVFCLYVFALGHIFKVAAEMAEDHARIV
jgi:hypothetical protein